MKKIALILLLSGSFLFPSLYGKSASAFSSGGCDGDCKKCHTLTSREVGGMLRKMHLADAKIIGIRVSPVKSLWEISVDDKGKRGVFYVDFSKKYLLPGPIVEVSTGENKTQESLAKMQANRKVDVSKIPLDTDLVIGNKKAPRRVIVFTDPECPFCNRLHQEMKKVVRQRKDIAFFIKLFPLAIHKDSYWKAKSIACSGSLKLMDDNFEGKAIPKKECATKEVDNNLKLAGALGISATPTIIAPDGRMHAGFLPADKLIEFITGRK